MATQAPASLPLLFGALEPLSSSQHAKMKLNRTKIPAAGQAHAIPLTVEEFAMAQRFFPIIFSTGEEPVPLALMGLNEGVNVFIDEKGNPPKEEVYIPAYLRRYPFMLAKLRSDSDDLSLCFDPTSGALSETGEGDALFDGDQPSETTKRVLEFCEQFEAAGQRTRAFMDELKRMNLLMEGEVAVQPDGADKPFLYRGFQMIDEDKLREVSGEELRRMNLSGMLGIIYAHLISLSQIRDLFQRQVQAGKGPIELPKTAKPAAKTKSNAEA